MSSQAILQLISQKKNTYKFTKVRILPTLLYRKQTIQNKSTSGLTASKKFHFKSEEVHGTQWETGEFFISIIYLYVLILFQLVFLEKP